MSSVKAKDAMNRRLYKRPIIVETAIYRVFGDELSHLYDQTEVVESDRFNTTHISLTDKATLRCTPQFVGMISAQCIETIPCCHSAQMQSSL